MSAVNQWNRFVLSKVAIGRLFCLLLFAFTVSIFQNCSNFDLASSWKSFNGYPYEGKLYAESSATQCLDGSRIKSRIRYFGFLKAQLLRVDCQDLPSPVELPANSFVLDPNDPDVLRYENRTLLAEQTSFSWAVKEPAPQLQNPLIITLPNDIQTSAFGCGVVYALSDA